MYKNMMAASQPAPDRKQNIPDDTAAAATALLRHAALTSVGLLVPVLQCTEDISSQFLGGCQREATLVGSSGPPHRAIFDVEGNSKDRVNQIMYAMCSHVWLLICEHIASMI